MVESIVRTQLHKVVSSVPIYSTVIMSVNICIEMYVRNTGSHVKCASHAYVYNNCCKMTARPIMSQSINVATIILHCRYNTHPNWDLYIMQVKLALGPDPWCALPQQDPISKYPILMYYVLPSDFGCFP